MKMKKILLTIFLVPIMWVNSWTTATVAQTNQQRAGCSIQGSIYGVNSQSGTDFVVVIFNPNNGQALGKVSGNYSPGQISYQISPPQNGIYLLRVFRDKSGYLFPANTSPSQRLVRCSDGKAKENMDFALQ
jgi:hypothetical protein